MKARKFCYLKTFGCQMNERDSEVMLDSLHAENYSLINDPHQADLIIINTCSIREKVEQKVYSILGRFKRLKEKNPSLIIGVGGCLAQQEGEKLFQRFPFINIVFGTRSIKRLPELVKAVENNKITLIDTSFSDTNYEPPVQSISSKVRSYVTIIQGCNNFCSYCIVPYVRGSERSRPKEEILKEIKSLAEMGVKEVILLGQNVNAYGNDLKENIDFINLLYSINDVKGIERIRFITSHPKDISIDLFNAYRDLKKLCEHIHLPVQSGASSVLRRMNRQYTREEYIEKVELLREISPDMSITTDIIVGFPGETEAEFEDTLTLLEKVGFDDLFSFKYSDRPGVAAESFPNKVDEKIKSIRLWRLQNFQRRYTLMRNKVMEGKIVEILVEDISEKDPHKLTGRTRNNKLVHFEGSPSLIGNLAYVRIKRAFLHYLEGELITLN